MQLIDTHCHLDLKDYNDDLDEVVARAVEAGVVRMIVPGIDLESTMKSAELAKNMKKYTLQVVYIRILLIMLMKQVWKN